MKMCIVLNALTLVCLVSSCSVVDEATGVCADKWEQAQEYRFVVFDCQWYDAFWADIKNTVTAGFKGQIQKTYCNGTTSGLYTFEQSYLSSTLSSPSLHPSGYPYSVLPINQGMQYIYKFEHDDDSVTITLEFSFQEFGFETKYYTSVYTITGRQVRAIVDPFIYIPFPNTNEHVTYQLVVAPM